MIPKTDSAGVGVAIVGHAAIIAALFLLYDRATPVPDEPPPMEVSFVEEVGPVSTAPESAAAPAPSAAEEIGPVEDPSGSEATIPETISPPVTDPVRPPVQPPMETGERRRPDLTRAPVQVRQAQPPRLSQVQPPRARPPAQNRPAPPQRPPAQPNRGPSFADVVGRIGRGPPTSSGTGPAPRAAAASPQQRATFTSALAAKISRCSRQQRPSTQEARSLRPVVVIRLRQDGSLDGAPSVRSVEGLNDTNRQYETQAREAIVRAVRNCAPYTGLPAELYSVPNGWRQPPPIRLNFQ